MFKIICIHVQWVDKDLSTLDLQTILFVQSIIRFLIKINRVYNLMLNHIKGHGQCIAMSKMWLNFVFGNFNLVKFPLLFIYFIPRCLYICIKFCFIRELYLISINTLGFKWYSFIIRKYPQNTKFWKHPPVTYII